MRKKTTMEQVRLYRNAYIVNLITNFFNSTLYVIKFLEKCMTAFSKSITHILLY